MWSKRVIISLFLMDIVYWLESRPGKTLLVSTIAQLLDLWIQSYTVYTWFDAKRYYRFWDPDEDRRFKFNRGPVLQYHPCGWDQPAPPKTQAALLEAMQERAVTVSGQRHILPKPFLYWLPKPNRAGRYLSTSLKLSSIDLCLISGWITLHSKTNWRS